MTSIKSIDTTINKNTYEPKKAHKHYLDANETVTTENLVKPLPGQGHLIKDNPYTAVKYFFGDIAYDMKSLKNGLNGTANDHQLGRLNDVGLKLGGIGIAAYLASRTKNPKARIMEYIGLGTFLAAMNLYPKIAINAPARAVHGYSIGKEFIDDQGRKKSVFQDSNYIPYDLYNDELYGEDLDKIGDKLGIPRDIQNRNDVIKEQMRKIATQNNTLWMLTAGFATPTMTALACCAFEHMLGNALEKSGNKKIDAKIKEIFSETKNMSEDCTNLSSNRLGEEVSAILAKYKDSKIPDFEIEKISELISDGLEFNVGKAVRSDLEKIINSSSTIDSEVIIADNNAITDLFRSMNRVTSKKIIPTKDELTKIINENYPNGIDISKKSEIIEKISKLIQEKTSQANITDKEFLEELVSDVRLAFTRTLDTLPTKKEIKPNTELSKKLVDFANIMGDFKIKNEAITKCITAKVEQVEDTIVARYYSRFENAFLKGLGISFKELEEMRLSEARTKSILDQKFQELAANSDKYEKTMKKLSNIVANMETALHGSNNDESVMKDLVNATENLFNKTAKRINSLGFGAETIEKLVGESVDDLDIMFSTRERVIDLFDGTLSNLRLDLESKQYKELSDNMKLDYLKHNHQMTGSYKKLKLDNLVEKYQGARNSFFRAMQTMDLYQRTNNTSHLLNDSVYSKSLTENIKDSKYLDYLKNLSRNIMLSFSPEKATLKFDIPDKDTFIDLVDIIWGNDKSSVGNTVTHQKGNVSDLTKKAFEPNNKSILERFQRYINTFKNIVLNDTTDFTHPAHIPCNMEKEGDIRKCYANNARSSISRFNLVAQDPITFAKEAANKRAGNLKWQRTIGSLVAATFAVTLLAQFAFGKINNKHNLKSIQKQVDNNAN